MYEVYRQQYLQALGIDSYIPRCKISFAADSKLCEHSYDLLKEIKQEVIEQSYLRASVQSKGLDGVLNMVVEEIKLNTIDQKNTEFRRVDTIPVAGIQSFSLSVWRPESGFLILASRNVKAMPTELLLNNFLRFYLKNNSLVLSEELLHWPAVENAKLSLTESDASIELQTWLSVQHEIRPITNLWFFGDAYRYFIDKQSELIEVEQLRSCNIQLESSTNHELITATILPDLNQFLLQPQLKLQLLSIV